MQRILPLILVVMASLLIADKAAHCQSEPTEDWPKSSDAGEQPRSVSYWIGQLGHDHFLRREMATKKLAEAGPSAITELAQVIRQGDLEVVERAVEVLTEIALAGSPRQDGGAWNQLSAIAAQGAGRGASSAKGAMDEIRNHRARQARQALAGAGVFVGIDEFAVRAISKPRVIVQIDDRWRGDGDALQWLGWLEGVENARVMGAAVRRDVLEHVIEVPGLKTLAIVDAKVDDATLQPLIRMGRIHSVEFRYVPLTDDQGDLIAAIPIRVSLTLMGTGISAKKVESMRDALPGLQIDHRRGGFLGVTCLDNFDVCEINSVVEDSAAEQAGLIKGDVIVRIGDTVITRFRDLQNAINQHLPGDEVEVKFRRVDKIETVKVRLGRFEET